MMPCAEVPNPVLPAKRAVRLAILAFIGCLVLACGAPGVPAPDVPSVKTTVTPGAIALPSPLIVSVHPFENRTGSTTTDWLRKGIPDMLVGRLAAHRALVVVQRDRLEEVLREQMFQLSGQVSEPTAVRVGRLAGATVLMTGSVAARQGDVRVDGQLIDVEQGTVLAAVSAEGPETRLPDVLESFVDAMEGIFPTGAVQPARRVDRAQEVAAAEANTAGERLAGEGKLFEALAEFERALRQAPASPAARANYGRTIQQLPGAQLIGGGGGEERAVADRLVERLLNGLTVSLETSTVQDESGRFSSLQIAVRMSLEEAAAHAFVEAATRVGAAVERSATGTLDVTWGQSAVGMHVLRDLSRPRRVYLRWQDGLGRPVATYSMFRDWTLARWVSIRQPDGLHLNPKATLSATVMLSDVTMDQSASIQSVAWMVESVSRERAAVRVDITDERARDAGHDTAAGPFDTRAVQQAMEEAWNPPIIQRTWSLGQMPRNVWLTNASAAVSGEGTVREPARVVRHSGSRDFDDACLAAFARVLDKLPSLRRGTDGEHTGAQAQHLTKVRVHCELQADIPQANLIGSQQRAQRIEAPVRRR